MYASRESHIPSYKLIIVNDILLLKMLQDINLQEKQINTIFTAIKSNLYFFNDGESNNQNPWKITLHWFNWIWKDYGDFQKF